MSPHDEVPFEDVGGGEEEELLPLELDDVNGTQLLVEHNEGDAFLELTVTDAAGRAVIARLTVDDLVALCDSLDYGIERIEGPQYAD